jgi:hypothetical protein
MLRILIALFFFCFVLTYNQAKSLRIGVKQLEVYLPKLKDKRVEIVVTIRPWLEMLEHGWRSDQFQSSACI